MVVRETSASVPLPPVPPRRADGAPAPLRPVGGRPAPLPSAGGAAVSRARGTADTSPIRGAPRFRIPPVESPERRHPDRHMLFWQVRGSSVLTVEGQHVLLAAGHALWVPTGRRHRITVNADSVMLPLWFPAERTVTTVSGLSTFRVSPEMRTLFLALVQTTYTALVPEADIRRQVIALLETAPVTRGSLRLPTSGAALPVARALLLDPADDRPVEQWAQDTFTSVRSIERSFVRQTGMTLRRWRLANRMEAAAALLTAGGAQVGVVAHRVGYRDHSAFSRAFRSHFGLSPRSFSEAPTTR